MSSPVLVGCGAALVALGIPILVGGAALDAQLRVAGAADAGALAAADALSGWVSAYPCELAAEVAGVHGVHLVSCEADPLTAIARVSMSVGTALGEVRVAARAGPPECADGC